MSPWRRRAGGDRGNRREGERCAVRRAPSSPDRRRCRWRANGRSSSARTASSSSVPCWRPHRRPGRSMTTSSATISRNVGCCCCCCCCCCWWWWWWWWRNSNSEISEDVVVFLPRPTGRRAVQSVLVGIEPSISVCVSMFPLIYILCGVVDCGQANKKKEHLNLLWSTLIDMIMSPFLSEQTPGQF